MSSGWPTRWNGEAAAALSLMCAGALANIPGSVEPELVEAPSRRIGAGNLPGAALRSYAGLVADVRRLGQAHAVRHDPETCARMPWTAAHGPAALHVARADGFAVSAALSEALRESTLQAILLPTPAPQTDRA